MAIALPTYATREMVQRSLDLKDTWRSNDQIDRAIETSSRTIDSQLHRVFYPRDTTYSWDWPNRQFVSPWELRLEQWDLLVLTQLISGGVVIPLAQVIPRPTNRLPGRPYTKIELDRSSTATFAAGPTPQNAIAITGTWGYTADTDPAGILAAQIATTSVTTMTVSDGSLLGVGDLAVIQSERLLITARATVTTGQTNLAGATTASAADSAVTVTDGTQVHAGEVLLLDQEQLLVADVTGNVLTVKRAWSGSTLAVHSAATALYAYRVLTVARGQLGTTAATHSQSTAVTRHRPPPLIRDLGIAEAENQLLQETSGYSRTVGAGDTAMPASGAGLADKWDEAVQAHGRKARQRAI